jgi:hypothetical protein
MALAPQLKPTSGVIGLPEGIKEAGKRVDFRPTDFEFLVETKGYRLAWSRAAQCPCNSVNNQTDQPDPNCPLCEGGGWLYFAPSEPITSTAGELDAVQQTIITRNNAAVVRGIMSSGAQQHDPYNPTVRWESGTMNLTVRHENRLGYYDKVVNLDSTIIFSELIDTDGSGVLTLRYVPRNVNFIRSVDAVFVPDTDYQVCDGVVTWLPGKEPITGTQVVCHYLMHPTWLVSEHPHVVRTTPVSFKTKTPKTPQGDPKLLPIQAVVRLDFLR